MKHLIKKLLREGLIGESMDYEDIGQMSIIIPFNKLVVDKLNLKWAIENIKDSKPSRSKDKPMQVAMGGDGKHYLLDGYHRFVEAIVKGEEKSTKGILLNKSFEKLKELNKIGVGCQGGIGDEFCSNFKNLGSIDMIKNAFLNKDK
jgi:hypothetical protein